MNQLESDLLHKKVQVMQQEISQVMQEMHVTVQGLARMVTVALKSLDERLSALEPKKSDTADVPSTAVETRDGVEL